MLAGNVESSALSSKNFLHLFDTSLTLYSVLAKAVIFFHADLWLGKGQFLCAACALYMIRFAKSMGTRQGCLTLALVRSLCMFRMA